MLAKEKVRYVGEPVAAVAARDPETAARAAQLIEIEYEPLPHVLSIDAALAPGAPLLHEDLASYVRTMDGHSHGNIVWESVLAEGDVGAAWAKCDTIVENVYEHAGAAARLSRNQRRHRRGRAERPHPRDRDLPIGPPRADARRGGARHPDVAGARAGIARGRRLRRQACEQHPLDRGVARARRRQAGEAGALARDGHGDPEIAPPGAHPPQDRRVERRPHPRARGRDHARRRRLCRREPERARLRDADGARALRHPERAHPRPRGLHQQAPRRLLSRLRQSAGELRRRIADRRARGEARRRSVRAQAQERDEARGALDRRAAGPLGAGRRVPRARARCREERAQAAAGGAGAQARHRRRRRHARLGPHGARAPACISAPTAAWRSTPAASISAKAPTRR